MACDRSRRMPIAAAALFGMLVASPVATAQQTAPPPAAVEDQTGSADTSTAREVILAERNVLILRGESTWDDGYQSLMTAFSTLRAEAKRLGLGTVGKPQTAFQETDDQRFKFEAMVFLDREPPADLKPQGSLSIGKSPAGKAFVFNHVGAYDDIDSVYEAITAWLDEKGLTARGAFLEEYLTEPQGSDDSKLELNIYVFVQ